MSIWQHKTLWVQLFAELLHPYQVNWAANLLTTTFIHSFIYSFTCLFILTFELSNPFTYPSFSITHLAKYILMLHRLPSTKFVYASINTRFNNISGLNNLIMLGSYMFPHNLLTKFKTLPKATVLWKKSREIFRRLSRKHFHNVPLCLLFLFPTGTFSYIELLFQWLRKRNILMMWYRSWN